MGENRVVNRSVPIWIHGGPGIGTVNEKIEQELKPVLYTGQAKVENDLEKTSF